MTDQQPDRTSQWNLSPAAKVRTAVQRSVTRLLDELAPERVLGKVNPIAGTVEQHRTPNGCVLQAADAAVSVSWFSDASKTNDLGELHVLVWKGKVTRRGSRPPPKGATVVADLVLKPIEPPADECMWQGADGTRYDTATLAAKCLSLLESQISGGTKSE
jgi:hypothetical protein